jgi:hypothetical protein
MKLVLREGNNMKAPRSKKIRINGVCGAATNDADYRTQVKVDGKIVWACPYYTKWKDMIKRCYSPILQKKLPTYIGCSVCDEWLLFSSFKKWMEAQSWEGKDLDKDLLFIGNKIYSPETCIFIDHTVNMFTTDSGKTRGEWPLGVYFHKPNGKFQAYCNNPFTLKQEKLGYFTCPEEAHLAWKTHKHELACQLSDSDLVNDPRVAEALRVRYL